MPLIRLKAVLEDACRELSLPLPPTNEVITLPGQGSDPAYQLLRRLITAEGRMLAKRHAWQALLGEKIFVATPTVMQVNSIPDEFSRMVNETMYDLTQKRYVYGPIDPIEWGQIRSTGNTLVNPGFRIANNMIMITPVPELGTTFRYEYVSRNWCYRPDGITTGTSWTTEEDTTPLDEEAMTLGAIWRYRADKGFEFGDDLREYERCVADLIMNDGARPRISASMVVRDRIPQSPTMPETLPVYPP